MKTIMYKATIIVCLFIFKFPNFSWSQNQFYGNWEGMFMNDFITKIELYSDELGNLVGKIQMFNGSDLIQDDSISKIEIELNKLGFYIESKETEFKGEFNEDKSMISGVFIFPDKSEHTLQLVKKTEKDLLLKSTTELDLKLINRTFTPDKLHEDLNFLVQNLKLNHPKLYSYTSEIQFNRKADRIGQNLNSELTIQEFFNLIVQLVDDVKCSHTGIRLPFDYQNQIYENGNFFPLKLLISDNQVFYLKNFGNSNLAISPGNELLNINNLPVKEIIKKLSVYIPSDGNNTSTKNYFLNLNFNSYLNLIDNSETFKIEYIDSGEKKITTLQACRYSLLEENKIHNESSVSFLLNKEKRTGYLTVKAFMFEDINKYIQTMNGIFQQLKNEMAQNLVLDLRGNSGGHPIFAAQLFSYLTNKEFIYFEKNEGINDFEPLYNKMNPDKLNFEGQLYVLTDGGCLSTSGHLLSLIKYYTNAKFIGEEPGSTKICNDYSIKLHLPNTRIEVNIPRTTFKTAIPDDAINNSTIVDFIVKNTVQDYFNETDPYLNQVNNLIAQREPSFKNLTDNL